MKYGQVLAFGAALALTTGGIVALASPASAEPVVVRADVPTQVVRYADLDLSAIADQKTLRHRVSNAVNLVCDGSESYANFQSDGFCRTAAWAGARPQIDEAIQRAQYLAMNGLKDDGAKAITITL